MKRQLGRILSDNGINHWDNYDDNNELSVVIISPSNLNLEDNCYQCWIEKEELTAICEFDKYQYELLTDIQQFVNNNRSLLSSHVSLVAKLEKLKHEGVRRTYQNSVEGSDIISEIRDYGFLVTTDWIEWNNYVPIHTIVYRGKLISVPPDKIRQLGYGVTSFKVMNTEKFRGGVYCEGMHPNVSHINNKFCYEEGMDDLNITKKNLVILKALLSHINLDNPYLRHTHHASLRKFIKEID